MTGPKLQRDRRSVTHGLPLSPCQDLCWCCYVTVWFGVTSHSGLFSWSSLHVKRNLRPSLVITCLCAILGFFHSHLWGLPLFSHNCLQHAHRLQLFYAKTGFVGKTLSPLVVFAPCVQFVPHVQSSRLVYPHPVQGITCVCLCKQASKVESIHLESGHCWINQQDAEWDWLRGYDVTLWFETLMTGTGLEGSISWKCRAALQRRHQMRNPRNSQLMLKGMDVMMHLLKKKKKKWKWSSTTVMAESSACS